MSGNIFDFGLCIIRDEYFSDFPNPSHMDNKHESRPYYLALRDSGNILWLVPISHQVEKYSRKIRSDELRYGKCIFYYIAKIKGERRVFLIGNLIPVSEKYIKKPFTVLGQPYIIQSETDRKEILTRVKRYLALVRNQKLDPYVDILSIESALKRELSDSKK